MATAADWLEGARPRTLFLSVAPVVAGTGVALAEHSASWPRAALALVVSVALQVGVNFANDYSDGIRGTDAQRVGPLRLVGSGAARPRQVLAAALGCFAVAGAAGLVLAALTTWWLVAIGAACIAAAWAYTGGTHPYGYRGLGELAVLIFFGGVAVVGTAFVQTDAVTALALSAAVPIGLLAVAVLVANNLRDIPGDRVAHKTTLAVLLGDAATRRLYVGLLAGAFAAVAWPVAITGDGWALLVVVAVPAAVIAARPVVRTAVGRDLIVTLRTTGQLTLAYALLLGIGLTLGR